MRLFPYFFALVWLVNGLICKVLNLVPRHREIVARIVGDDFASLTPVIGVGEILMAVWIGSQILPRWSARAQMLLVVCMNTLEFLLAPDLLLWGRWNAFFALLYVGLVYWYDVKSRSSRNARGRTA